MASWPWGRSDYSESELDREIIETLVDLPVLIRIVVVVVNQMMLT